MVELPILRDYKFQTNAGQAGHGPWKSCGINLGKTYIHCGIYIARREIEWQQKLASALAYSYALGMWKQRNDRWWYV